ncbi:hypothetical protein GQ53DRAFT_819498 [Thozetella sp. PMI_491]|nr:hypothetical protein GQ53DRAFT_819498 [Thozetella sp. PMI_491]
MNDYDDSVKIEKEASQNFRRLGGPEDRRYLTAQLAYAYPLIERGELETAWQVVYNVFEVRRKLYGPEDLFAASAQFSMGDIQRKQRLEESIDNIKQAFDFRRKTIPLHDKWALDFAIELLIAYWDFSKRDLAQSLLPDLIQGA